jgi:hypothetical protein
MTPYARASQELVYIVWDGFLGWPAYDAAPAPPRAPALPGPCLRAVHTCALRAHARAPPRPASPADARAAFRRLGGGCWDFGPWSPGHALPGLCTRAAHTCALRAHRPAPPADAVVSFRCESPESTEIQVASHPSLGRAWECAAGGVALLEVRPLSPFLRCDSGRPALLTLFALVGRPTLGSHLEVLALGLVRVRPA